MPSGVIHILMCIFNMTTIDSLLLKNLRLPKIHDFFLNSEMDSLLILIILWCNFKKYLFI